MLATKVILTRVRPILVTAVSGNETIEEYGIYKAITWLGSGSITFGKAATVDIMVIAGGGGGSSGHYGAGGGAGGMRVNTSEAIVGTTYTITVGDGATNQGTFNRAGNNGSPSSFSVTGGSDLVICVGGGGGGYDASYPSAIGGSGGGGGTDGTGADGTSGEGFAGSDRASYAGGGGGGKSGDAVDAVTYQGADGSDGITNDWRDGSTAVPYAGGGGGASYTFDMGSPYAERDIGRGGSGGGGDGSQYWQGGTAPLYSLGTVGSLNTGGGGGGAEGHLSADQNGFAGGKGIVILRYLASLD